jgi:xanthine dehydrogenase YagR molybdenum-binding subunit
MSAIGIAASRVDGRAKVTGEARYAAEFTARGLLHGFVVSSAIAKGRIRTIDRNDALAVAGVAEVFTHENRPDLADSDSSYQDDSAPDGSPFRPLHNDRVVYSAQPVALVVAETLEIARFAASLVRIDYQPEPHVTDLRSERPNAHAAERRAKPRGDAKEALRKAPVKTDFEYWSPIEHHNPMETHATTVVFEADGKLTIYDKTQGVQNVQRYVANVFGLAEEDVRVLSPFVGGAFGSGLRPQYQLTLAVMAARALERSIRVVLTRQQMFTFGHRPATIQRVALGANRRGSLAAITHDAVAMTSQFEDQQEHVVEWSGLLYKCANTTFTHKLAKLDLYTPLDMRAPGGALGLYAIESAMDELSYELGMDPLELRLKNYSNKDQNEGKRYSSKKLRECYRQGAEKFGWADRKSEPRSMRAGDELMGWGMATGIWEAMQEKASAKALLTEDGKLEISSATADIGPGTYTIMTQIAAETLGLPIDAVTARLGDSSLPEAPVQGGSFTAASVGSAVYKACTEVAKRAFALARKVEGSPLARAKFKDVMFADAQIRLAADHTRAVSLRDALKRGKVAYIQKEASAEPRDDDRFSKYIHSAIFVEVRVDEELGVIRVTRVVNAVAAGRILNPKTARSQVLGGVVWGIGMALHEETLTDHNLGRFVNANLGEYHVPVNADIQAIDIIFVEEIDKRVNPLGVKGVGEIGVVGTAAAIANAIFHATGTRVRDLPITLDKLLVAS